MTSANANNRIVVLLSNSSWGVYNYRKELVERIKENGYQVWVLAPRDKYSDLLVERGVMFKAIPLYARGKNPFQDLILVIYLLLLYLRIKPNVALHFTVKPNIYGNIVAGVMRVPVINTISGLGSMFDRDNRLRGLVAEALRISLSSSRKVFFQNERDRRFFRLKGIVRGDISGTIPGSGVDIDQYDPARFVKGENGKEFVFLMAARLKKTKGVEIYINAARKIKNKYPDVVFWLAGEIDEKDPLFVDREMLRRSIDERVITYLGFCDNIVELIAKSDCVVLPTSYREGVPRIIIEASAMEKPVIASRISGCADAVTEAVTGYLVRRNDVNELADRMERVISMPETQRKRMGEKGRIKIKNEFNAECVIGKYMETISECVGEE